MGRAGDRRRGRVVALVTFFPAARGRSRRLGPETTPVTHRVVMAVPAAPASNPGCNGTLGEGTTALITALARDTGGVSGGGYQRRLDVGPPVPVEVAVNARVDVPGGPLSRNAVR